MTTDTYTPQSERRKQVRLRKRPDISTTAQRYEGRTFHVVKDPINLKYFRFNEQEYYIFSQLDGRKTLEDIQKEFERRYRPDRLNMEELEVFARQLVNTGLVQHESPNAGRRLFEKRVKERRLKRFAAITNIMYIKLPLFDPDRLLTWLYRRTHWIFTNTFLILSVLFMLAAAGLVAYKFQVFWDKLPAYQEFFRFKTLLYMWISLGIVKVIHEFGHGLSCKAFGGECHEMGALFMCFSPSLFANVTDSWTLASKWQRIIISFAGIHVELVIAAISTFVWWYTPHWPFVNNIALCLMTLCSVTTFVFNANPLMKFDGYYILADLLEVPNLREKSNKFLGNVASSTCLGVEIPPQPYMAPWRKWLFVIYAIASWIYRWVVTFSILFFLANWLKPYNLETLSNMLAVAALFSMTIWPLYRLAKNIHQRGRLPDMKRNRVRITVSVAVALLAAFFFLPLPVNRVRETGLLQVQEPFVFQVTVPDPGGFLIEQYVQDGDRVVPEQDLAAFRNPQKSTQIAQLEEQLNSLRDQKQAVMAQMRSAPSDPAAQSRYQDELAQVDGKLGATASKLHSEQEAFEELKVLRAKNAGVVMGAPNKDKMFMFWDKAESGPFCRIGDTSKLRVSVPVSSAEYREIKDNLERERQKDAAATPFLEASILLSKRSDRIYHGRVTAIPEMHEMNLPMGLTSRGGGPIAVRPSQNPNTNEPIAQTYLIQVEITDPDGSFCPGTLAKVKIHLRWRSAAWWCGQKIASALDWGLW